MAPFKGWLNPSYTLASSKASCQRLVNLFAEVIESGDEKAVGYLRGCPGLTKIATIPSTGSTGTFKFRGLLAGGSPLNPLSGASGRIFAVVGSLLFELDHTGTPINGIGGNAYRGDVGNDGLPVQMFPNGNQLGIVSNGQFWIDNGAGPVAPTFPGSTYTDISVGWGGTFTTTPWGFRSGGMAFGTGRPGRGGGGATRVSGPKFNAGMVGLTFAISGDATVYTITSVVDEDHLTISPFMGTTYVNAHGFTVSASNTLAASAANPFTQADLNASLKFTATSPFSAGPFTVTAVDVYGNATLSGSPAAAGSTNGQAQENFGPILATSGAFLNSYFIVAPPASKTLYVSAPLDGTSWDPGFLASKESYPDHIGSLLADHQQLLVAGETHAEVWQAPGVDPNFPFAPNESLCLNLGIAAPASLCSLIDGPVWIGGSLRGGPIAYSAKGFFPVRISTHAIEQAWKAYGTFADAVGFTYEWDGHEFWHVSFPTGDAAWVYDATASAQMGKPMWHERTSWDGSAMHRHRAICHAYVFGAHWVGDFANGNLYQMSDSAYQDNGQPITCIRTLPHLCAERRREFFTKLQIDLDTGGANALTLVVEWSDDGGVTFVGGGANFTFVTSTTAELERAAFFQLGASEDRVFRITITGNARKTLTNAYLETVPGLS